MKNNTSQKIIERPILFNGEMVRSIISGRKKQTRRIAKNFKVLLKKQVSSDLPFIKKIVAKAGIHKATLNKYGAVSVMVNNEKLGVKPSEFEWVSPFGKVGDRLWVRETSIPDAPTDFYEHDNYTWSSVPQEFRKQNHVFYKADAANPERFVWKPSIHMPRWASRLNLEITNIRVERLQDISEEGAKSEGMDIFKQNLSGLDFYLSPVKGSRGNESAKECFKSIWNSIYKNWDSNPWVWVVEFKVVSNEVR